MNKFMILILFFCCIAFVSGMVSLYVSFKPDPCEEENTRLRIQIDSLEADTTRMGKANRKMVKDFDLCYTYKNNYHAITN